MTIIDTLSVAYHPLLELWIQLDDNLQYFALGAQNRTKFIDKKNSEQIAADISGEDVVRCRGFLKSITYYNKRIVRPK